MPTRAAPRSRLQAATERTWSQHAATSARSWRGQNAGSSSRWPRATRSAYAARRPPPPPPLAPSSSSSSGSSPKPTPAARLRGLCVVCDVLAYFSSGQDSNAANGTKARTHTQTTDTNTRSSPRARAHKRYPSAPREQAAAHQLEEHHAKGKDVDLLAVRAAGEDFWRHVHERADLVMLYCWCWRGGVFVGCVCVQCAEGCALLLKGAGREGRRSPLMRAPAHLLRRVDRGAAHARRRARDERRGVARL